MLNYCEPLIIGEIADGFNASEDINAITVDLELAGGE